MVQHSECRATQIPSCPSGSRTVPALPFALEIVPVISYDIWGHPCTYGALQGLGRVFRRDLEFLGRCCKVCAPPPKRRTYLPTTTYIAGSRKPTHLFRTSHRDQDKRNNGNTRYKMRIPAEIFSCARVSMPCAGLRIYDSRQSLRARGPFAAPLRSAPRIHPTPAIMRVGSGHLVVMYVSGQLLHGLYLRVEGQMDCPFLLY